mgnify:CR=1 FL=1
MRDTEFTIGQGRNFATLGNAVAEAIQAALNSGMEVNEATCVVAQVAADYARRHYGNAFLPGLCHVSINRGNDPLPGFPERELEETTA